MIEAKVRETAEAQGVKSSYELQHALGVAPTVALRLWRGEVTRFSLETLDKLCSALNCQPGDLLIYVPDEGSVVVNGGSRKANKLKGVKS